MTQNKPPKHLSPAARRIWREILAEFELGPESLPILNAALSNWDRILQAREALKSGITIGEGDDTRRHPAIDIEKQAYSLFLRAWRQLALDIEPPRPVGRPPKG